MSPNLNCPFCDSLEEKKKGRITGLDWENTSKVLQHYFSNFTYTHYFKLCDSCLTYLHEFCKYRTQWSINENAINEKRRLGQFKGLKNFVKPKKESSLICRLCFKENRTEEVIFIYLENNIYHPGHIKKILTFHANDIDLNITENPVICQECFNVIQTFDALYQMCLENQAEKAEPDLIIKSSGDSRENLHDTENIVHVQLKKSNNDSLVTEEESAVISLIKNKELSCDNIVLNGCTTKNVLDLVEHRTSQNQANEDPDVCIITDDDELESDTPDENNPRNMTNIELMNEDDFIPQNIILVSNHSESGRTFKINSLKSDVIEIYDSDDEPVGCPQIVDVISPKEIEGSQLQNDPVTEGESAMITPIKSKELSSENVVLNGWTTKKVLDLMQHRKSQKQDNENPNVDIMGENGDEDVETIPTINMEEVSQLFENNEENILLDTIITEKKTDSVDIVFADELSNPNSFYYMKMQSKDLLEENLSSFLQFNNNNHRNTISNPLKRSHDSNDDITKKAKIATINPYKVDNIDNQCSEHSPTKFSLAFEQFVINRKQQNISPWKLLRGFIFNHPKEDDYCSWFPFIPQNRKMYPSIKKKFFITVVESRCGICLYRCNICLHIMKNEFQANCHDCPKFKQKKTRGCPQPKCTFYSFNEFLFSQHMEAHNLIPIDSIQELKCKFCDFFSSDKECMINHKKKFHEKSFIVKGTVPKCPFCFFQSKNPDILAHHIVVRHNDQAPRKSKFTEKHV